jgi:hypothetical protein
VDIEAVVKLETLGAWSNTCFDFLPEGRKFLGLGLMAIAEKIIRRSSPVSAFSSSEMANHRVMM